SDVRLVLSSLGGHDPLDPDSDPAQPPLVLEYTAQAEAAGPPRLGLPREALHQATPRVREHTLSVASSFERAGARVQEVSLGESLELILAVHQVIMQTEAAAVHWQLLEQYPGAHQA